MNRNITSYSFHESPPRLAFSGKCVSLADVYVSFLQYLHYYIFESTCEVNSAFLTFRQLEVQHLFRKYVLIDWMPDSSVSCIPARGVCSFEYVVSLGSTFSSIGCLTSLSRVYLLGVFAHLNMSFL